jgi:hypothetical protein
MTSTLRTLSLVACVAVAPVFGGCASGETTRRLDALERGQLDRDRREGQNVRAWQELANYQRRLEEKLQRLESQFALQQQERSEHGRAIREALELAQASSAVTRRLEIRQLGGTPLIVVKP